MALYEPLLNELLFEANSTRKMLELVPEDKFSWKPHEKSMTMGQLASHLAEMPHYAYVTVEQDVLDFATSDYKPKAAATNAELLQIFDDNLAKATQSLKNASDERLLANWKMQAGEEVYMDMPRTHVLRGFVLNHNVHHRGQLSVYLRLNDIALPSVYGPTADEAM